MWYVLGNQFAISCLSLVILQILKSLEPGADVSTVYGADHLLRLFGTYAFLYCKERVLL